MKCLVWDKGSERREGAKHVWASSEWSAAIKHTSSDKDGLTDGLYTKEGHEIQNLARDGRPVCVEDEHGNVTEWRVGVVEFEPVFGSVKVEAGNGNA